MYIILFYISTSLPLNLLTSLNLNLSTSTSQPQPLNLNLSTSTFQPLSSSGSGGCSYLDFEPVHPDGQISWPEGQRQGLYGPRIKMNVKNLETKHKKYCKNNVAVCLTFLKINWFP